MQLAMETGDFNRLFEGPGFSDIEAESISTAKLGQIVTPSITSAIGEAHHAEYLIQGTIINLGRGKWMNPKVQATKAVTSLVAGIFGMGDAVMAASSMVDDVESGVGVQSDMRIIKANTGEVVWRKIVTCTSKQNKLRVGVVSAGNSDMNMNMYTKAMDLAAQEIVDALVSDMSEGRLFVK